METIEKLINSLPYSEVIEMLNSIKKDLWRREKETLRTIHKIEPNYNVPEWYITFDLWGLSEYFQITKKPSGEICISN
jgi:hypothetical protein